MAGLTAEIPSEGEGEATSLDLEPAVGHRCAMASPGISISIAMTSYNGARFIAEQLKSLLSQTIRPEEIIVCDDQSLDGTVDIARNLAKHADIPIVVSVNESRLGYRANFMRAASLCSGELIAFCDQDDVWRADKLEIVARAFSDRDVLLVFHNAELVDEGLRRLGHFVHNTESSPQVTGRLGRNPWNAPLGFTQTFRKELLQFSTLRLQTEDPFAPSEHLAHDQWIPLLAGAFGKTAYVAEILADYRQHGTNLYGRAIVRKSKVSNLMHRMMKYSDYERLSRVARKISHVFEADQFALSSDRASAAEDARHRYAALADYYADRAKVYVAKGSIERARAWNKLQRLGAYAPGHPISFLGKSFARDLLAGVLLGGPEKTGRSSAYYTDHDDSLAFGPLES